MPERDNEWDDVPGCLFDWRAAWSMLAVLLAITMIPAALGLAYAAAIFTWNLS